MRWPETGLTFVPTSQNVRDFSAVIGYAMIGLGCEYSGFTHGLGTPHPFRSLAFEGQSAQRLRRDLQRLRLPGLSYRIVQVKDAQGRGIDRVYVDVTDWETWNPTELSFWLQRLACEYSGGNPFARLGQSEMQLFNKHVGSTEWWEEVSRKGRSAEVERWLQVWRKRAESFREASRRFWLYP